MPNKLNITREAIQSENYEAEEGIIVLVSPKGVSPIRWIRKIASDVLGRRLLPDGIKRFPNDGQKNVYKVEGVTKKSK